MTVAVRHEQLGRTELVLTFDDFVRMSDEGYFGDAKHLELVDGRVYDLAPISPGHGRATARVTAKLVNVLQAAAEAAGAEVFGAVTLQLDARRAVQPDAAVLREPAQRFAQASEALLVVEIAASSQAYDLGRKRELYAEGGVPEYWVIDEVAKVLTVFRRPRSGRYEGEPDRLTADDKVAPLFAPHVLISVSDLL